MPLGRRQSGFPAWPNPPAPQTETTDWVDQVVTNGGSVSRLQQYAVDNLVLALKNASLWASLDDMWLLCAESSIQALTSLKGLRLATTTGSPSFVAKRGYTFDGSSNYVDTGWVASTMASALTTSSTRLAVWELTNVNSTGFSAGTTTATTTSAIAVQARVNNNTVAGRVLNNNVTNTVTLSSTDSIGYTAVNRSTGPVFTIYKDGASLGTYTPGNPGPGALPSQAFYIGALNNNGSAGSFRANTVAWADVGASLSSGNETTLYGIVQTYLKAMGAA